MEKVILFGASRLGQIAQSILQESYEIIAFCDNSSEKWGNTFCGIRIISPEELRHEEIRAIKVIITSQYYTEIYKQLHELEINNILIFNSILPFELVDAREKIEKEKKREQEKKVRDKISDEKKKKERLEVEHLTQLIESGVGDSKEIILHMMFDNFFTSSFINFVNSNFSENEHKFIVIVNSFTEIKYVNDVITYKNVEVCYNDGNYTGLIFQSYVSKAKKVFLHYLTDFVCKLIHDFHVPKECELNWVLWGADLYTSIDRELYDEKTKSFLLENSIYKLKFDSYKGNVEYEYKKEVIKNLDFVITNCEGDYRILKENFETNALRKEFIYPNPVDFQTMDKVGVTDLKINERYIFKNKFKNVILLGNSGDPSNNHIDILYKLQKIKEQDFCVICPLSYGNSNYIEKLISFGKKLLGDKFIAITEFLDSDMYYSILKQVDIAIMNHRRQQAVGNIMLLMYLNKNLYINSNNPFREELVKLGVFFHSIDMLQKIEFINLQSSQDNRERIKEYYDVRKCIELWRNLFSDNSNCNL